MTIARQTVVILGAGINGCALARELALGGFSVVVVERADVAAGTTAYSSRLIHGGLRYLEYGELDLVRESLEERGRLLRLAPQFVRPLELFVPVRHRLTQLWQSAGRLVGWNRKGASSGDRGLWLVAAGLWLYDKYAHDPTLPRHQILPASAGPPVNPTRYRWVAAYYDAQVAFPERLSIALLTDACQAAASRGNSLRVLTDHEARLVGRHLEIRPTGSGGPPLETLEPAVIVNATGAWVDLTLARLPISSKRLVGGTKGSHFVTARPELAAALAGRGIYAEAADGRPVFILPLAGMTLVGTTDEPYAGDPYHAVAREAEIDYLIAAAREVFPQIALERRDVAFSYSGVRPLPYVDAAAPAAITRRHAIHRHAEAPLPLFSLVGGKLTTCRALAEAAAAAVAAALGHAMNASSRERPVPGSDDYPATPGELAARQQQLAEELGYPLAAIEAVWRLVGTLTGPILREAEGGDRGRLVADTDVPLAFARHAIRHEWAKRLDDLVERRLMLLYKDRLTRSALGSLAELLVAEGRLPAEAVDDAVQQTVDRLASHFGKSVAD